MSAFLFVVLLSVSSALSQSLWGRQVKLKGEEDVSA
jgi:hypothetical protein